MAPLPSPIVPNDTVVPAHFRLPQPPTVDTGVPPSLLELTAVLLNKPGSAQPVKHIAQGITHPVSLFHIQLVSPPLTHKVSARKRKCWFQTSWTGHILQQKL